MKEVGICGHYGGNNNIVDGQTIKVKVVTEAFEDVLGADNVNRLDTYNAKKHPFKLIKKIYRQLKYCKRLYVLPGYHGVHLILPAYAFLNLFFKRHLAYSVIGGWLPELIQKSAHIRWAIKRFDAIYVETKDMKEALENLGFKQIAVIPNFKKTHIVDISEIQYFHKEPYPLCTFSRVMKEKGIEIAIDSVIKTNKQLGRTVYTLDIYGPVIEDYKERFTAVMDKVPESISYKGVIDYKMATHTLRPYFAMLFPTYYMGEGFAGGIVDAYSSGVPVIASDWRYNKEVVIHNSDGLIFDYKNSKALIHLLLAIEKGDYDINAMKNNCLKRAEVYQPRSYIQKMLSEEY